jgi:hypothetical protein
VPGDVLPRGRARAALERDRDGDDAVAVSVSSTTTAGPRGTTEPAEIRRRPRLDRSLEQRPAGAEPMMRSFAPACATSAPRTAKPSIAELSAAGTARPDVTSSVAIRPHASDRSTRSSPSAPVASRIVPSASSTEITLAR